MKKIIFILFALALTTWSCNKVLDVKPTDSVAAEDAIKNKAGVEHAINGSYNSLQAVGLYSRNAVIVGDIASDNLVWTGTMQEYGQVQNKPIPAENSIVDGMWYAAYSGINCVNNILIQLPGISGLTQAEADQYEGESLFIRALLHYYLATYFGGVPIQTQPTLDLSNIDIERSSQSQVFDQVIADLTIAKAKMSATKIAGHANTYSASALLAKAYLSKFQLSNDQPSAALAIAEAENIISNGGYTFDDYKNLFDPKLTTSPESIFEVLFDVQNYNRLAQYFFSRSLSGRYEVAPSTGLLESYELADTLRFDATVAYDTTKNQPYGYKYSDVSGGTDHVYVLRLAEMYLIRAEALAYSNGAVANIQADINAVRNRAGLGNTTAATIPDLKLAIENECRHEFAFEGHRWPDLVRTKRASAILGIDEKFTLFPIPLSEMQTNKLMEQNPGY
ncbi:MAG: RagB/SusD family nutrient uptake outer membrane protein [Bacteroidota bacterium]